MIAPALQITLGEREFVAGDGSLGAAMAGHRLRFVYCSCGQAPKAKDWRAHLRNYVGARSLDDNGPHDAFAIERIADHIHDCVVFLAAERMQEALG